MVAAVAKLRGSRVPPAEVRQWVAGAVKRQLPTVMALQLRNALVDVGVAADGRPSAVASGGGAAVAWRVPRPQGVGRRVGRATSTHKGLARARPFAGGACGTRYCASRRRGCADAQVSTPRGGGADGGHGVSGVRWEGWWVEDRLGVCVLGASPVCGASDPTGEDR